MPGLLEQGMGAPAPQQAPAQQQAPAPQQAAPQQAAPPGGPDKKELDVFVANGMKLIHNEKISDRLIAAVMESKNKVKALADAALSIVWRLEKSAEASGKKLSLTTLAYGGNILMGEIIASAEAAGMKKMDDETKAHALSLAVSKYLDDAIKTGKISKDELQKMSDEAESTPVGQEIVKKALQQSGPPQKPAQAPELTEPSGEQGV
jgi:hypothetical protein